MTPERYELLIENGIIYLRAISKGFQKGYTNVEATRLVNGKSLGGLIRQGEKLAKHFKVPFVNRIGEGVVI